MLRLLRKRESDQAHAARFVAASDAVLAEYRAVWCALDAETRPAFVDWLASFGSFVVLDIRFRLGEGVVC